MDNYKYHKIALVPVLGQRPDVLETASLLSPPEKEELVSFIHRNGLGPLWHQLLKKNDAMTVFPGELVERLEQMAKGAVAHYLQQKYVLDKVATLLKKESIVYAIFKGCHIREIIYEHPASRPASDIDILVYPSDVDKVITTLVGTGFTLEVKQQNASHEATLVFRNVAIDLHWHILRPGRLRTSLTDEFLARRQDYGTHSGFDVETTLFVMLVHPVFTKYSTTYLASLVRFVDLLEWVKQHAINWDDLLSLLQKYGVCTAAWITAVYLQEIAAETLPKRFLQQIQPSFSKQYYLKKWIQADWASKLLSHPLLIQLGFTLPAHDTIVDALRFLKTASRERRVAQEKTEGLLRVKAIASIKSDTDT